MLPRKHRLTKEKDFNKTFKSGKSCFSKILGVKSLPNNLVYCRFGFVVSNKVSKKATQRNKIKRQLRDITHQELKNIKTGYDVLILALAPIIETDYPTIKKEFKNCFKKLNLLDKWSDR